MYAQYVKTDKTYVILMPQKLLSETLEYSLHNRWIEELFFKKQYFYI